MSELQSLAKKFLASKNFEALLSTFGTFTYTGSYALDLMTWNDIDIQIEPHPTVFNDLFCHFSKDPELNTIKFIKFEGDFKPKMSRGVYLGLDFNTKEFGNWKVDLWILSPEDQQKSKLWLEKIQSKLTPESKKLILNVKTELTATYGRVPQGGSFHLYEAALFHGLQDKAALLHYLKTKGVV